MYLWVCKKEGLWITKPTLLLQKSTILKPQDSREIAMFSSKNYKGFLQSKKEMLTRCVWMYMTLSTLELLFVLMKLENSSTNIQKQADKIIFACLFAKLLHFLHFPLQCSHFRLLTCLLVYFAWYLANLLAYIFDCLLVYLLQRCKQAPFS